MTDAYALLSRMAFGHTTAQIVYAAVRLGVPDLLAEGPMPAAELADATGADPETLGRLLRALVALRVLDEPEPGRLALTPVGRPLCAGHPRSMRAAVLLLGDPATWRAWGALTYGVRTGETAFDHVHGLPLFDYLGRHPELSAIFNDAMREGTSVLAAEVPKVCDLSGARQVVDIGGGAGALLAAVVAAVPQARGILFDTAEGGAGAPEALRRAGVDGRCSVVAGDFFASVPEGDLMLLKGILHDWDDERCVTLLRNCRASIAPGGRLLVLEPILPEAAAVMSDIAMLVYTGGRERSREEYRELLAAGGFELTGVTAPLGGSGIRVLLADPGPTTTRTDGGTGRPPARW
ncbi:methyltransferase [Nonomuraea typhae]|uniref:methyltransferase n=1 Tax=Nonomuraea typhae TaxID=2603600 RepID=UPI0012F940F4|nr:methyltransferase [Nonomuraea typhae]